MSTRAITRTVRRKGRACGIIADMSRVLAGLAAWLGGTAAAVGLAWFGAGLVVRNTTTSPSPAVPVVSIAPAASSVRPDVSASASTGPPGRPQPSPRPSLHVTVSPSRPAAAPSTPMPAATPSPAGTTHSYTLDGGQVTLLLTGNSAKLVTAVPDAGWSVQTWSGPQWLRVDFSSGAQVSSLIASWNGEPPTVVTTN
jgi:hypothetical protein